MADLLLAYKDCNCNINNANNNNVDYRETRTIESLMEEREKTKPNHECIIEIIETKIDQFNDIVE